MSGGFKNRFPFALLTAIVFLKTFIISLISDASLGSLGVNVKSYLNDLSFGPVKSNSRFGLTTKPALPNKFAPTACPAKYAEINGPRPDPPVHQIFAASICLPIALPKFPLAISFILPIAAAPNCL